MENPGIRGVNQNAPVCLQVSLFHDDCTAFEFDYLPIAYLAAFAQFHITIDFNAALRYHRFCHTSAGAETRNFQQVIQLDKIMTF
jgi:hypothetical protein